MKLKEVKYSNKLDDDGFEINPELIEECIIWLTGGAVGKGEDPIEFKNMGVSFHCRLKLFGNTKNIILTYDVPISILDSLSDEDGEKHRGAFRWGVDQILDNIKSTLDKTLNELFKEDEVKEKI